MLRLALVLGLLLATLSLVAPLTAQESTPEPITYVIQRGDTLLSISRRYDVTVGQIMRANNISNPELIFAGQTIIIPSGDPTATPETPPTANSAETAVPTPTIPPTAVPTATPAPSATPTIVGTTYVVQPGDTLAIIAQRNGITVGMILRANNLPNPDVISVGQRLLIPPRADATPVPTATPEVVDPFALPALPFGYGVEVFFPDDNVAGVVADVTALSLNWAKVNVYWRDLEATEGAVDVTLLDDVVTALDAAGVNILFTISTTPAWAGVDENSPPDDFSVFATFAGALADHYAGVVDGYEIWSEPNLRARWNNPLHPLTPASYGDLLRVSYTAIRTADMAARVVSAGLFPVSVSTETALNDREYLTGLYSAGLRDFSDAVGARPLGFGNSPDIVCCQSTEPSFVDAAPYYFLSTLSDYRGIMTQNGDAASQLWITGFGWGSSADTAPPPDEQIYVSYNTLEEQSLYTGRAFEVGAQLGFVGPMILTNLNGCAVGVDCYYSLLDAAGQARPIYDIVRILFTPAQ